MKIKIGIILTGFVFLIGCAGAHYQALPGAPRMEKGEQRIAMNMSISLSQKTKMKWYIPENWLISNWGYSFEYRYGVGKDTDIGIYPAGFNIFPCAIDIRWLDKMESDNTFFHRLELLYNPVTYNEFISNGGIRYDYFTKRPHETEDIRGVQGVSFLMLDFWDIRNGREDFFHPILGFFSGGESENIIYEFDYLPGFNYFTESPHAKNPLLNLSNEKENIPKFLTGDLFFGIAHGNSYTEKLK